MSTPLGAAAPLSMTDWQYRVESFLRYGDPSQKAIVCEGEAGNGKSEMTVEICKKVLNGAPPIIVPGLGAQQQEELLSSIKLVDDGKGGAKVVQGVIETLVPTAKLLKDKRYRVNGRTCIPWIIDEIFTGNTAQSNQIRAALAFRQIGGVQLPEGVFIIGTTNPDKMIYSSRRNVDAAIMDRMEIYQVSLTYKEHQAYLLKAEQAGNYPEVCRMFLRMDENRDLWPMASARFWSLKFGDTWKEISACPTKDVSQQMRVFQAGITSHFKALAENDKVSGISRKETLTADALIGRFKAFIEHGDDPRWYPISANRVLGQPENWKDQVELFEYWRSEEKHGFIGVTMQDLSEMLITAEEINEEQAAHIAVLLNRSGSAMATQLCKAVFDNNPDLFDILVDSLAETEIWDVVIKAMRSQMALVKDLRARKKEAGRTQATKSTELN